MMVLEELEYVGIYIDGHVMMIVDAATGRWCCYS